MRSHHGRPRTTPSGISLRARPQRGFSMVELLVTIVLAGIIFAAMVPFFANALKRTSADEYRVDSTNIAQDRIEQVRLLPYKDIASGNLNYSPTPPPSPFGDGRFGPTYTLVGESRSYHIDYVVDPAANASAPRKHVTVRVSRAGESFVTTADTIIMNPAPGDSTTTDAEPTNLSLEVWFDPWNYVKSPGVVIRRVQTNVTPNATTTPTPTNQMPDPVTHVCTWTGLIGGPNYTYTVMCSSTKASYVLTAPSFRMWTSGRIKFDTYPGGD